MILKHRMVNLDMIMLQDTVVGMWKILLEVNGKHGKRLVCPDHADIKTISKDHKRPDVSMP